ncbi:tetratricopeptide repeat protein [Erythrobacter sp. JK5]|uniref:tetratricopeptide repeat protein n=1 Tax=Erythrobacter sp. JK5 TaxID=2829500 RepID=UPI001BA86B8C|nr:tetratricopeptide repeat protein [Erythrobacter sp. JK5]QUL38129.1 hypothetical protein KDC96_01515 [Erythrobacter sp. JK5]
MKIAKLLICSAALVGLSGCQSFLAELGFKSKSASEEAQFATGDSERLELGREALRAGAPGNAIYHFERAVLDPKVAPEAYNGLGIAYVQLGREDLAERFFNVAVMLRPSDTRFARNLNRLYQSQIGQSATAVASREAEADRALAEAASAAVAEGLIEPDARDFERRGAIVLDNRRPRIQRSSTGEIAVATVREQGASAPQIEVASRRVKPVEPEPEAPEEESEDTAARISQATRQSASLTEFPTIACATGEPAPSRDGGRYPIRVGLNGR